MNNDLQYRELLANGDSFKRQMLAASWFALSVCVVYQFIVFPSLANVAAIACVFIAWLVATSLWLRRQVLENNLLSAFILLGFVLSQFYFPLLFTTLENKPLIFNLELPEQVFLHSSLTMIVLVVAHEAYRFLLRFSQSRVRSLLETAGLFTPPSHLQVWIIGLIGMISSAYVYVTNPDVSREMVGSAHGKLMQALVPFSYAPFFIPLAKLYGNHEKPHRGYIFMIAVYALVLLGISMARNSRAAFMFGLTTPVFAYCLGLLLGVFKAKIFTFKNFAIASAVIWLLAGPLSDLGTAMLIVRGSRKDIKPQELISQTLATMGDKRAIEARKQEDLIDNSSFDWDEHYLDNLYTARFANIKFNDLSLIAYEKVGPYDPNMIEFAQGLLISSLPEPLIKFFKFDIDKEWYITASVGDILYLSSGGVGPREAFRIGHLSGTGMATYSWWYLLAIGIVVIPVFYLHDVLFRRRTTLDKTGQQTHSYAISFCAIMALTSLYQFLLIDSIVQIIVYFLRGWLQMVALYFISFHVSRLLAGLFSKRRRGELTTIGEATA